MMVSCSSWIGRAGEQSACRLQCSLLCSNQRFLRAEGTAQRLLHAGPHRLGDLRVVRPQVVARPALRRLDRVDPRLEVRLLGEKLLLACLLYTSDAADDLLCVDLG